MNMCSCEHMWGQGFNISIFLNCPPFFFETGSFAEPGAPHVGKTSCPERPKDTHFCLSSTMITGM